MNDEVYLIELIGMQLFLGSIVYLFVVIIVTLVLFKKRLKLFYILLINVAHVCFSILISLLIWSEWTWNMDIMLFGFLNIPAMIGEIIIFFKNLHSPSGNHYFISHSSLMEKQQMKSKDSDEGTFRTLIFI